MSKKRLFFGLEVNAPWPHKWPKGRLVPENCLHFTLAFLGNVPWEPFQSLLLQLPLPTFEIGRIGIFDQCLFLPQRHPHVVAWHAQINEAEPILSFQQQLSYWLIKNGYKLDERPFLPHVTVARSPLNRHEWKSHFTPLPFMTSSIHLYESKGNLSYFPVWSYPISPPIQEIDHTADIAFVIRGESIARLHLNAAYALAFKFPVFQRFIPQSGFMNSLEDIVIHLNQLITTVDQEEGCPFKAVSFHGQIKQEANKSFSWEMIVDV